MTNEEIKAAAQALYESEHPDSIWDAESDLEQALYCMRVVINNTLRSMGYVGVQL